jgi:GT2 family glycosyltransferase
MVSNDSWSALSNRVDATIAIPTMDPPQRIFEEVLAIAAASGRPIVIVDMSIRDGVRQAVQSYPGIRYEEFKDSPGVSASRNRCVALAETSVVVFLDSDAYPRADWADPMIRRLAEPDVGVVGARILPKWEVRPGPILRSFPSSLWLSLLDLGDERREIPRVIGTSYAIHRDRVPDPPFDEQLGRRPGWLISGEENKLCVDSRNMGYKTIYEPESVVFHHVPRSRASWRYLFARAYAAGREQALTGREEPFPSPPETLADRCFKLAVALPFVAGRIQGPPQIP